MRARLFAKTGPLAGASFEIREEASIGRAADNQIVLPGGLVSSRHGRIVFDARQGCYLLEDLASRNGTFLAGSRIREPEKLGRLDVINFAGAFDFIFQVLEDEAAAPPPAGGTISGGAVDFELPDLSELPPAALAPEVGGTRIDRDGAVLPASLGTLLEEGHRGTQREEIADWVLPEASPPEPPAAVFTLRVEHRDGAQVFELPPGEHLVGRGKDCGITLDDPALSRHHARLVVEDGRVSIADLGSTNHTFVAGRQLDPNTPIVVEPGIEIHFAEVPAALERRA